MKRFAPFNESVNGVSCAIDPTDWTEEQYSAMVEGLVHQGLRIILQRATAGAKDPEEAIRDKAKALQEGNYAFGGGGGGKRLTYPEKAVRVIFEGIFRDQGMKAVDAKAAAAADDAWQAIATLVLASEGVDNPTDDDLAIKIPEIAVLLKDDIDAKAKELERADKKTSAIGKLGLGKK